MTCLGIREKAGQKRLEIKEKRGRSAGDKRKAGQKRLEIREETAVYEK